MAVPDFTGNRRFLANNVGMVPQGSTAERLLAGIFGPAPWSNTAPGGFRTIALRGDRTPVAIGPGGAQGPGDPAAASLAEALAQLPLDDQGRVLPPPQGPRSFDPQAPAPGPMPNVYEETPNFVLQHINRLGRVTKDSPSFGVDPKVRDWLKTNRGRIDPMVAGRLAAARLHQQQMQRQFDAA